jgi:N-acetylmuramoyl-L-alanine amidase
MAATIGPDEMMRRAVIALLLFALSASVSSTALAGRGDDIELRSGTGSLGRLPRVILDDGAPYVAAERLASVLGGSWSARGTAATLVVAKRVAQFARDRTRVVVAGKALTLDAPPRVGAAGWLLPVDFLTRGLSRLVPRVTVVTGENRPKVPATKPVKDAIVLQELRFRSYPSFTRVVVETASPVPHAVVPGQDEVRVSLPRLGVSPARVEEVGDGLVKQIRLEASGGDAVLRVALESTAGDVKVSTLQDPFRLVLDIYRRREVGGRERRQPDAEPLRLIVLDAGHGGHDPGATGPTGLMEKDVVLDVTRRVAKLVDSGLGVGVALTRNSDVFIPLRERTNFANKRRADLFVSIHANAHPRAVSEGVEVYFLSSEASDKEARQVAALENGVIQLEAPGARQKGDLLKSILWDLAQSEFQQESSFMAETVLDSMTQSLRLVPRGVKQAGFYVLGGAAMPAVLIEIGFMTNPREERMLANAEYREAIARAIYAGLAEYKRRHDQRVSTAQALPPRTDRPR